jgi:hypothetical protein
MNANKHEAFRWNEHGICTNPIVYSWKMKRLSIEVAVAENGGLWFWATSGHNTGDSGGGWGAGVSRQPGRLARADRTQAIMDDAREGKFPEPTQKTLSRTEESGPEATTQTNMNKTIDGQAGVLLDGLAAEDRAGEDILSAVAGAADRDEAVQVSPEGILSVVGQGPAGRVLARTNTDGHGLSRTGTDASARAEKLVVVEDPDPIFPVTKRDYSNGLIFTTVVQQLSCHDIEKAIEDEDRQEENHRQKASIHALRSGLLYHVLRMKMGIGHTDFWNHCATRFQKGKMTIWRKMRLAGEWMKEMKATSDQVLQLAQAPDLSDTKNDAVQLAFNFVGDMTTTDLYRKYKLISSGPKGGDNTPRDAEGKQIRKGRRTKEELAREDFETAAMAWGIKAREVGEKGVGIEFQGAHLWDRLDDEDLETFRGYFSDIKDGIVASQARRRKMVGKGK